MVTLSPTSFAMLARSSALIGNLCVPLPRAMNELLNGRPSTVPLTFTSPRVLKYCAEPGMTTYVHPPLLGLRCNFAVNVLLRVLMVRRERHRAQRARLGVGLIAAVINQAAHAEQESEQPRSRAHSRRKARNPMAPIPR